TASSRSSARSQYMEFAKLRSAARYNLATSGIESFPIRELPVRHEELEITGPSFYGYQPLQQRLAEHCNVAENCVAPAIGTSLANHLALAATTEPGDEILIEDPTYELITSTARFLGLAVRTFARRFEDGYRIDPDEVRRRLTPRTRLVVFCNLHNPSGVMEGEAAISAVGEICRQAGVRMMVDEVYLDAAFEQKPRSAFHIAPDVAIVTSSLTKAYGLSGLRCGWVVGLPEVIERVWRINDLFGAVPPHTAELLSVVAFDHLDRPRERARNILMRNRPALEGFLRSRDDLEVVAAPHGTTAFPRLTRGSGDELFSILQRDYEASIVPGRFFGDPRHFRIGIGGDPQMTAEGLRRLGLALDQLRK
ncbi:MAG TPA: pyridoxal phosphate-dependent aminotransferase, partial [Terriglobales bacterium]|nr:pyridoxal phosphate-dependent aminotransferase [Terriglobales bacterium]